MDCILKNAKVQSEILLLYTQTLLNFIQIHPTFIFYLSCK